MRVHGPGYRIPRSGVRRLHVDGVEYSYRIRGWHVQFFLPDKKVIADLVEVTGKHPYVMERGQWKKTQDGYCTPADCKRFLQQFLKESTK